MLLKIIDFIINIIDKSYHQKRLIKTLITIEEPQGESIVLAVYDFIDLTGISDYELAWICFMKGVLITSLLFWIF